MPECLNRQDSKRSSLKKQKEKGRRDSLHKRKRIKMLFTDFSAESKFMYMKRSKWELRDREREREAGGRGDVGWTLFIIYRVIWSDEVANLVIKHLRGLDRYICVIY